MRSIGLGRLADWMIRHKERIKVMGLGMFIYQSLTIVYANMVYPLVVLWWGSTIGVAMGICGSLVLNGTIFWLYDHMRIDWLWTRDVHEIECKPEKTRVERLIASIGPDTRAKRSSLSVALQFMSLCLVDPLIVAIHFQRRHFQGLGVRDWSIFLGAVAIGNVWCLTRISILVIAIHFIHAYVI